MAKKKTKLRLACENSYGHLVSPGTDIYHRLLELASKSTINRYIRRGFVKPGPPPTRLILTRKGYQWM